VVPHDVTVNNLIPHDVPIEIPRIVPPPPSAEARTPAEQRFAETPGWRGAIVRGRILRELGLGFVMATDHGEQSFAPAKVGASGEVEADGSMKDLVADFIGDLAFCSPSPSGLYRCVALHGGKEVVIPEVATGGAAL
jgi:hypothetical protein